MTRRLIASIFFSLLLGAGPVHAQGGQTWLTVEVTNEAGRPLSHACVTFVPKEGEIIFRKADGRGRVKLKRSDAVSYRVVVKVDGYEAQKREVAFQSKNETVAFALQARRP